VAPTCTFKRWAVAGSNCRPLRCERRGHSAYLRWSGRRLTTSPDPSGHIEATPRLVSVERHGPLEHGRDAVVGVFFIAVPVEIRRRRDRRVAEEAHQLIEVETAVDEDRCRGVTERMDREAFESYCGRRAPPGSATEVVVALEPASLGGEDEVTLRRAFKMTGDLLDELQRDRECSTRPWSLSLARARRCPPPTRSMVDMTRNWRLSRSRC
jgi:hypothetical protein